MLEPPDDADGFVDPFQLIFPSLFRIFECRGGDGVVVAAIEAALRMALLGHLSRGRTGGIRHAAPCDVGPPNAAFIAFLGYFLRLLAP